VLGLKKTPRKLRSQQALPDEASLANLAKDDPVFVLQQLSAHLDALCTTAQLSPPRIYELVDLIDRTGRPHYRTIADTFVRQHKDLTKFQEQQLCSTALTYLTQLAQGYRRCLAQCEVGASGSTLLMGQLPAITGRAMRASAARLKWFYLRYLAPQAQYWSDIAHLYLLAEQAGFAQKRVPVYRGVRQDSSVEREFLQALLLAAASPASLLPEQIDIAEQLVARFAPEFVIAHHTMAKLSHFFDLSEGSGPQRVQAPSKLPDTARAFGAGTAIEQLEALAANLDEGSITAGELGLRPNLDQEIVRATVRHLLRYWNPPLPRRRHTRQREVGRVTVLHGFDEVASNVGGVSLHFPFVSDQEHWIVENRSRTGLNTVVHSPQGRWLSVGALIALRESDDAAWTSGLVRRIQRDDDDTRHVAVETLARGGAGVTVLPHLPTKHQPNPEGVLCVLLPAADEASQEIKLLMPSGAFSESTALEMRAYDHRYLLIPIHLVEAGTDWQVARFKILRPTS
jgi:hypothetical protein